MSTIFLKGLAVLGFISFSAMFLIWLERKVSAWIQNRMGPMMTGFQGTLQPVADTIKLLLKEDIVPKGVDFLSWWLAPFFVTVPVVMAFLVIPFSSRFIALDLNVGVLYICSVTSICVLGIFMAGWGSNNKYSLLGGMRSAAQIISYEVPLLLSVLVVIMETGTLSMQGIVHAQAGNLFLLKANVMLAFVIYLISAT
ncbi:MAG: NADH-quinone oxidoreductase subunit H, partial [Candidatus Omnitrophica bacterium]|nr:NADH-quinone oxidoreductase subunit H [Candidatus Omnitrophota bacterium]